MVALRLSRILLPLRRQQPWAKKERKVLLKLKCFLFSSIIAGLLTPLLFCVISSLSVGSAFLSHMTHLRTPL